ncbi:protein EARLY-RESPONSIVE TO DEHYDRATION 7, chloroplastic-like, partial [Magnolia sinica]|uniref:protein EARLY-RESPONSIVE TO DEHYDRATION 7, chloroplastic-like n=1 Tax=Magnolia sinica TaxID=86752 RepID=UPI00265AA9E2
SSSLYSTIESSRPSSLYPTIESSPPFISSSSSMYPSVDMNDLVENLFPNSSSNPLPSAPPIDSFEETLITIPGAIVHLIDKHCSVELASGDLTILRIRQGVNTITVLVCVGNVIQWPLAKDAAAVKLDDSHYFFALRVPSSDGSDSGDEDFNDGSEILLNYGLTIASKGQEGLLKEFDAILEKYSSFSVQQVLEKSEALDGSVAKGVSPAEMEAGSKKEMMEEQSVAYWTTLAPNVEEYGSGMARGIAAGSGQLIKGIVWCGDVTVERLKWGDDILKRRMGKSSKSVEVSNETLERIKRVKRVTMMSEKVAIGVLSGVVKVTGFFTSSIANSKVGKKFLDLLPGEVVLASLDGFGKVCDAVEIAGKNVISTSSVVTTGLVSQRYGNQAAELTNEGLNATGHALGTAWAVFKISKAINPKSAIKPTHLAKSAIKAAAADIRSKQSR